MALRDLPTQMRLWSRKRPERGGAATDPAAIRRLLEQILASKEFASANRLQSFLTYVVERKLSGVESVKETELALEVFNRRSTFDPAGDSVVRVAAGNLRSRLRDYYLATGSQDPVIIELPKGTYVPVFRARDEAGTLEEGRAAGERHWLAVGLATALVAVLAAGAVYWALAGRSRGQTFSSIAVLPFLNLSSQPESQYMTDGFVEELTTALAQIQGLKVVARSSAFQFRGQSLDIRTVGRQLGVDTVLEGSLRTVEGKVHVTAQLIKTADGFHIWSRTWEGDPRDLFAIQDDLARELAGTLQHAGPLRTRSPKDPETYDLYLKGQYFRERVTLEDLKKGIGYLEQATARDPAYAPAFLGLAQAYASLAYHEVMPDRQAIAQAKQAAEKALALDDSLAEAHALLAWIRYFYDWDWQESERGLRRAVALNPNSASAHDWYAQRLMAEGRFSEALGEAEKALVLDPLNYRLITNKGVIYHCAHRYDEAIRQCRRALDINPHYYAAYTIVGASLAEKHLYPEAAVELRAALAEYAGDADTVAHLAAVELALGNRERALELLARLEAPPEHQPPAYYELAFLKLKMGHKEEALEALEKAYEQRSSDLPFLAVDPVFDSLHREPRFLALLEKLALNREIR